MPIRNPDDIAFLKSIYPFRNLEEQRITVIAEKLDIIQFKEGDTVYEQGQESDNLYIVYRGRVKQLISDEEGSEIEFARLHSGDLFGYEMLDEKEVRRTSACAISSVHLITASSTQVAEILELIPELNTPLRLLYNSFQLSLRVNLKWRSEDEAIYYISRRHRVYLLFRLLAPLIAAAILIPFILLLFLNSGELITPVLLIGLVLMIISGVAAWIVFDWTNDYSVVTNRRVLFQEKIALLYDSLQEAPLSQILSVSSESDQIGRIINYGNVRVRTYAGLITLPGVESPGQVEEMIRSEWTRASEQHETEERASIEKHLSQRLGYIPLGGSMVNSQVSAPETEEEVIPEVKPGFLQNLLNTLFHTRMEKEGIITYRTHWIMLIKNVWFQSLLLLAFIILWFGRLVNGLPFISIISLPTVTLVIGIGFIFIGLWWLYGYVDWRNDYYQITYDQVLDVYRKPLGREERRAAPLKNIQSIEFSREGLIGLVLNFGTVFIRVGDTDLTFDNIFNPSQVQRELFNRIGEREQRDKETHAMGERKRLTEWLEAYHRVVEQQEGSQNTPFN